MSVTFITISKVHRVNQRSKKIVSVHQIKISSNISVQILGSTTLNFYQHPTIIAHKIFNQFRDSVTRNQSRRILVSRNLVTSATLVSRLEAANYSLNLHNPFRNLHVID